MSNPSGSPTPLARASVRQEFLRRSRRWRDQVQEETSRLREQFQQVGLQAEERLEGWLEDEPAWERVRRDDDDGGQRVRECDEDNNVDEMTDQPCGG